MSRAVLAFRRIAVKARPVYTCEYCGARADGDTVSMEIDFPAGATFAEVGEAIAREHVSNTHMPEGWAGYGMTRHRCPECKQ